MSTVLVTGFEPFGGDPLNPSMLVLPLLHDGLRAAGVQLHTRVLPCVFGDALKELDAALAQVQPDVVIALGLAASRDDVTVERVAINVDDARIPDNAGRQPIDTPVEPQGPAAYFSTLPIKRIVAALRLEGLPASVSQTAGTFVCNHVFYGLMHRLAGRPTPATRPSRAARGGFVHLPALPEQARLLPGRAGVPLHDQVRAVQSVIRTTLASAGDDLTESGGAVD